MHHQKSTRHIATLFFLFSLISIASSPAFAGSFIPVAEDYLVQKAPVIVVGVVDRQKSFWNDTNRYIMTSYHIDADEFLKNDGGLEFDFWITVFGGTIGEITHKSSSSVYLETNTRYLLFIDPDKSINPVIGGPYGRFRESDDFGEIQNKTIDNNSFVHGDYSDSFSAFVSHIRKMVNENPGLPDQPFLFKAFDDNQKSGMDNKALPSKLPEPPNYKKPDLGPVQPPRAADNAWPTKTPDKSANGDTTTQSPSISRYHYTYHNTVYITFEPLLLNWFIDDDTPYDQNMMSRWNAYADVIRVYTESDYRWSFGNGVNEICGYITSEVLAGQGLETWGENEQGKTFYSYEGGIITEADIMLNPDVSWTANNEYSTRSTNSAYNLKQILLHEIGHALGLDHPWEYSDIAYASIMNYAPKQVSLPVLYTNDTEGVRRLYPDYAVDVYDANIFGFNTTSNGISNNPSYHAMLPDPNTVEPGGTFILEPFTIDNTGTQVITIPQIEVYLTPSRLSWDDAIYLDTLNMTKEIGTFATMHYNNWGVGVPESTPPGEYYIGLYLRDDMDDYTYNNSTWSTDTVKLTVKEKETQDPPPDGEQQSGDWTLMDSGTGLNLYGVWAASDTDVFAVGNEGIVLHYNGTAWSFVDFRSTGSLRGVWGVSATHVYVVGEGGEIVHYDGTTAFNMDSGTTQWLHGIWGASGSDIFAVGNYGVILHYNGGAWSGMNSGTDDSLSAVWGASGNDVFAVATTGAILHYNGANWSPMASNNTEPLNGVWGSSGSDVFAVGDAGTILHYNGTIWSPMVSGATENIRDVHGSSGDDVFAVGWNGLILHYDGAGWSTVASGADASYYDVCRAPYSGDYYAVGLAGKILHYDDGTTSTPPAGDGVTVGDGEVVDNTGNTIDSPHLGANAQINGGTVTGNITGESGSIITNAFINADTIAGVAIGTGCILTESCAKANPEINLLQAAMDETGQKFVLDHTLIKEKDGDQKRVQDLIADEVNAFLGDTTTATNPTTEGAVSITAQSLGDIFAPGLITELRTTNESDQIRFTPEADILVARSGASFALSPYPAGDQAFAAGLTSAGWSGQIDPKGVAVLDMGDGSPVALKFSSFATYHSNFHSFAAGAASFTPQPGDPGAHAYTLLVTYPDGSTQNMYPSAHDVKGLSEMLNRFGLPFRLLDNGNLELLGPFGTAVWRGVPDMNLRPPQAGITEPGAAAAGDVDGNGMMDYDFRTSAASQYFYAMPLN